MSACELADLLRVDLLPSPAIPRSRIAGVFLCWRRISTRCAILALVNADDFRRIALSLAGAKEGSHMGAPDVRGRGRIFATLASQRQRYGNLMLTPEQQAASVEACPKSSCQLPAGEGW